MQNGTSIAGNKDKFVIRMSAWTFYEFNKFMLDTVIQNKHLNRYFTSFDKGTEIFLEGDDT